MTSDRGTKCVCDERKTERASERWVVGLAAGGNFVVFQGGTS